MHIEQFFEWICEPDGSSVSATRLAAALGLEVEELASIARVDPDELRLLPSSCRGQAAMLNIVRVVSALAEVDSDISRAMLMLRSTPVREFDNRSLLDVVREGRVDDAVAYLRSVSSGFAG